MRGFVLALMLMGVGLQAADLPEGAREIVEHFMREKQVPGVAAAVYYQGQSYLVNFGLAGPSKHVSPDTIFEIASITKVFTSTALSLEVLNGRMQLNAPITEYLPRLNHNQALKGVTLRALASHSASMPRIPPGGGYTHESLMRYFSKRWRPEWPVGSKYLYSNVGFGLLGYALAAREEVPYFQVLERLILQPLGMNSTWIVVPQGMRGNYAQGIGRNGNFAEEYRLNAWPAGGALRSTSRDMLKFLLANLGVEGPEGLLKAMQFAQEGIFNVNDKLTIGLAWQRFQEGGLLIIDKNGGVDGFSSYIGMIPEKKIGVVLLANRGFTQITETGRRVLRELNRQGIEAGANTPALSSSPG